MHFEGVEGPEVRRRLGPAEFVPRGHVEDLPAKAPVAEDRIHVVVAAAAAMAELPPLEHTAEVAHGGVERIRVADEPGITRVEVIRRSCGHAIIMPLARCPRPSPTP